MSCALFCCRPFGLADFVDVHCSLALQLSMAEMVVAMEAAAIATLEVQLLLWLLLLLPPPPQLLLLLLLLLVLIGLLPVLGVSAAGDLAGIF